MNGNLDAYAVRWFIELLEIPISEQLEMLERLTRVDFAVRKHWEAQKDENKQVAQLIKKAEPLTVEEVKQQKKLLHKDMRKRLKMDAAGGTIGH